MNLPKEPGQGCRAGSMPRLAAEGAGLAQLYEHAEVLAESYVSRFPEAVPAGAGALKDALLAKGFQPAERRRGPRHQQ